jgi:hypothetical protein
MRSSGGSLSSSQVSSIQQTIGSAQSTLSSISNGGGATVVSGPTTWAPSVSPNTSSFMPNQINGVLPVTGGNSPGGAAAGIGAVLLGAGAFAACAEFCTAGGIITGGLGSTGRTQAANLAEQLAMQEVKADPSIGAKILGNLGDPRWAGLTKMQYVKETSDGAKIVIHYVVDSVQNIRFVDDFKFIYPR